MSHKTPYRRTPIPATVTPGTTSPVRSLTLDHSSAAAQPVPEVFSGSGSNGKKRSSKVRSGQQIARSASIPQIVTSAMSESELDKKRNKLGYQRISIACAHCRRRKIRCLVAEGDPQQRCQNCIRLKKDCVFYPVDQQGALDNRSQQPSQSAVGSGPGSVVSSSPNNSASERVPEHHQDFTGFPSVPSNMTGNFQGLNLDGGVPGSVLSAQDEFSGAEFGYPSQSETHSPWIPTSAPGSAVMPPPAQGAYWRSGTMAGVGGDFTPFTGSSPQQHQQNPFAQGVDYGQRAGQAWQQQPPPPMMRSMSYSHEETLPMNAGHGFGGSFPTENHSRHPAMRYPPSTLDVQSALALDHEPGPRSAPLATQYSQPHPYMLHNNMSSGPVQHPNFPGPWFPGHQPYSEEDQTVSPHGGPGQYLGIPQHPS